ARLRPRGRARRCPRGRCRSGRSSRGPPPPAAPGRRLEPLDELEGLGHVVVGERQRLHHRGHGHVPGLRRRSLRFQGVELHEIHELLQGGDQAPSLVGVDGLLRRRAFPHRRGVVHGPVPGGPSEVAEERADGPSGLGVDRIEFPARHPGKISALSSLMHPRNPRRRPLSNGQMVRGSRPKDRWRHRLSGRTLGAYPRSAMAETNRSTTMLEGSKVLAAGQADVAKLRERTRLKRIFRLTAILGVIAGYLAYRYLSNNPIGLPHLPNDAVFWL